MRLRKTSAWLPLALIAAAWPAAAQEQTGAIEGTVRDTVGGALPTATVEARSAAGAVQAVRTSSSGGYRFPLLRPGRYEITATVAGFNTARVQNVDLALGQVRRVDLTLAVGSMTEEMDVTAEAPLVDVRQSGRSANIRDEFVDKVPKGRDFTSLATQAPGANIEKKLGGLSIDGASAAENKYVIDGIETNDLQTGVSAQDLITDFVEEVQVKSSGYAAEYSGAVGGVVNAITRSGTNDWHGSVWGYFSGDGLGYSRGPALGNTDQAPAYGDGRPSLRRNPVDTTRLEYVTHPEDDVTQIEPGFSIGGPLVRDKVWLFAGYNPQFRNIERSVTLLADGATRTVEEKRRQHFANASLSAQLGPGTRGRLVYNLSRRTVDGILPSLDGTDSPDTQFDIGETRPNWSLSASLDHVASSTLAFGLRGGYFAQDEFEEGRPQGVRYQFGNSNVGMPGVPAEFQRPSGFATSASNLEVRQDEFTRLDLQGDVSWFVSAAGQHQFKMGVQFFRLGNDVDSGETGNRVIVRFDRNLAGERGAFGYYQVRSAGSLAPRKGFSTLGSVRSNNWGLFVQDSWTIAERLTLNVGLRTEKETVPSFTQDPEFPGTAIAFDFEDKLAPRLGFAWDVRGDARWKVYGSWGIFYDITRLAMPRGLFGGDRWLEYYYALETPDWTNLASSPDCPPACPGRLLRGPVDFRHPTFDAVDPGIEPYKLQEASVGLEHELASHVSVAVRYVHKQVDRAIEDIGSLDAQGNEIYTIGNPGLGVSGVAHRFPDGSVVAFPRAKRDYDAVELSLNKRMVDDWALRVSYLWSRLHGNYTGLSQGDENGRISPNVGRNFDYPLMSFDQTGQAVFGLLPTDRTHQFKTQLIYDFDFGLSAGVVGYVASGIPVTREASFLPPNNFPVAYLGRNSDGRTDAFSQLDLSLIQEFRLSGNKRIQVMANILNLFDQRTAINRWRSELEGGQGIRVSEDDFYRGVDTQALIAAQGLVRDVRFLQDSEFQAPREVRLGLRLTF